MKNRLCVSKNTARSSYFLDVLLLPRRLLHLSKKCKGGEQALLLHDGMTRAALRCASRHLCTP
jgi:hypothetical protein